MSSMLISGSQAQTLSMQEATELKERQRNCRWWEGVLGDWVKTAKY